MLNISVHLCVYHNVTAKRRTSNTSLKQEQKLNMMTVVLSTILQQFQLGKANKK